MSNSNNLEQKFWERISFNGKLEDISQKVCEEYNLGNLISNKLFLVGYEDFNYILQTNKGKYFVKVFANFRSPEECKRYVEIIGKAIKAKVSTPKMYKSKQGELCVIKKGSSQLNLCVLEYIDGNNLFTLNELPNEEEIKFLSHQAALINSIKIKPSLFVYDEWAITSFPKEFARKGQYLNSGDMKLVKPLLSEFEDLKIDTLPHAFVHGDLIATNVVKDKNAKLWIVDFAVSNYYPRIQELAVLACNLFYRKENKNQSESNFNLALREYQKSIKLTTKEKQALPTYIQLAHAMHILSANYQKVFLKNTTSENEYWLEQGRTGLR